MTSCTRFQAAKERVASSDPDRRGTKSRAVSRSPSLKINREGRGDSGRPEAISKSTESIPGRTRRGGASGCVEQRLRQAERSSHGDLTEKDRRYDPRGEVARIERAGFSPREGEAIPTFER